MCKTELLFIWMAKSGSVQSLVNILVNLVKMSIEELELISDNLLHLHEV